MYRKSQQEQNNKMEKSYAQNAIEHSQFFTRLFKLPVVHSAVVLASDFYGKAKNSGGIVGRTIGLAESTSVAVAEQVIIPYAQKFSPLAAPVFKPLEKVDALASFGLEQIEKNAPIITKEPGQIVTQTRELVSAKVSPAVERFNSLSSKVLGSPVAQIAFDVVENLMDTASNVVDHILPPKNPEKNGSVQNGYIHEATPVDKSARAGFLIRKAYYIVTSVAKRIFPFGQSKVLASPTPSPVQNQVVQNGESKPSRKQKQQTAQQQ